MVWKNDQVSREETQKIVNIAKECLAVNGDYVEMGCYKGDTSLLLAELLQRDAMLRQKVRCPADVPLSTPPSATPFSSPSIHAVAAQGSVEKPVQKSAKKPVRKLWIYDSFEGLPEKTSEDASELGRDFKKGELLVTKREVKQRFLRAGLPVPIIKKAWFNKLTDADMPEKIAFAFLDGDLYESIRESLKLVENKMAEGSVIIVHDYNNMALPGVVKAVDEWCNKCGKVVKTYKTMAIIR